MTLRRKQRKPLSKRVVRTNLRSLDKQVARQKKTLSSLAGIGVSGFTDISVAHDMYLHEKP